MFRHVRFQFFDIRTKQNERGETGGRDRVAFRDRFHRVADGVQLIRHDANSFRQIAHYRDAARVVGDRPERIERNDNSRHRQHRHHRDRDSIKTGKVKAEQDRDADESNRQRGCVLTNG